jgi:TPR repeat protein
MSFEINLPFNEETTCLLSNKSFKYLIEKSNNKDSFPYLIVLDEANGIKYYDAQTFVENTENLTVKVHLFALDHHTFKKVAYAPLQQIKQLYFSEKPEFSLDHRDETIQALQFYYRGEKEGYALARCFYRIAKEQAENDAVLALCMGIALSIFPKEQENAMLYFAKSADRGNAEAAMHAGRLLYEEDLESSEKAYQYFKQAYEGGKLESKYRHSLAGMCREGNERALAKKLLLEMANEGDRNACYEYAKLCESDQEKYEWFAKSVKTEIFCSEEECKGLLTHSKRSSSADSSRREKPHVQGASQAALLARRNQLGTKEAERCFWLIAAVYRIPEAALIAADMISQGIGGAADEKLANALYYLAKDEGGYEKNEIERALSTLESMQNPPSEVEKMTNTSEESSSRPKSRLIRSFRRASHSPSNSNRTSKSPERSNKVSDHSPHLPPKIPKSQSKEEIK